MLPWWLGWVESTTSLIGGVLDICGIYKTLTYNIVFLMIRRDSSFCPTCELSLHVVSHMMQSNWKAWFLQLSKVVFTRANLKYFWSWNQMFQNGMFKYQVENIIAPPPSLLSETFSKHCLSNWFMTTVFWLTTFPKHTHAWANKSQCSEVVSAIRTFNFQFQPF